MVSEKVHAAAKAAATLMTVPVEGGPPISAASDSLATNRSAARLRGKRSDRRFTRSMAAGPHLGMGRKCLRLRVPIALLRADSGAEKILEVNGIR